MTTGRTRGLFCSVTHGNNIISSCKQNKRLYSVEVICSAKLISSRLIPDLSLSEMLLLSLWNSGNKEFPLIRNRVYLSIILANVNIQEEERIVTSG